MAQMSYDNFDQNDLMYADAVEQMEVVRDVFDVITSVHKRIVKKDMMDNPREVKKLEVAASDYLESIRDLMDIIDD